MIAIPIFGIPILSRTKNNPSIILPSIHTIYLKIGVELGVNKVKYIKISPNISSSSWEPDHNHRVKKDYILKFSTKQVKIQQMLHVPELLPYRKPNM